MAVLSQLGRGFNDVIYTGVIENKFIDNCIEYSRE